MAAKKLADEAEDQRQMKLRAEEKRKKEEEKARMEEILRKDKELRFGKKFDEKAKEDSLPAMH